jgi:hypothetical protein
VYLYNAVQYDVVSNPKPTKNVRHSIATRTLVFENSGAERHNAKRHHTAHPGDRTTRCPTKQLLRGEIPCWIIMANKRREREQIGDVRAGDKIELPDPIAPNETRGSFARASRRRGQITRVLTRVMTPIHQYASAMAECE